MATGILDITEAFEKARRNLLLIDSIIVVFWFAAPADSIKVPGLGTDVAVRTTFAFILLGVSLIMFFIPSFWFEWRSMSLSHRTISYGVDSKNLMSRLDIEKSSLQKMLMQVNEAIEKSELSAYNFQRAVDHSLLNDLPTQILEAMDNNERISIRQNPVLTPKFEEFLEHSFKKLSSTHEETTKNLHSEIQNFKGWISSANGFLEEIEQKLTYVNHAFKTMSRQISTSQRVNYGVMFVALPLAFSTFAIAACLLGASGTFPKSTAAPLPPVEQKLQPFSLMPL